MHSVRPDKPVPPLIVKLLSHVDSAARVLDFSYFVGGAFARDLLLMHVHGFDMPRPTRDVDIGIAVGNWEDFDRVKARLIETREFSSVPDVAHRLRFRAGHNSPGIPLDLLPFAGVEEPNSVLRWPQEGAVVMNVAGFEEALARAENVKISDSLTVPVASLPGQTLLKLVAWLDRRRETSRDAIDLLQFFRRYGDAGNMERLYDEKPALLAAVGFDIERAGATLLGEDVRAIAMSGSYERLTIAFTAPAVQDAFLTHVSSNVMVNEDDRVARAQTLIEAFFSGFGTNKSS